MNYEHTHTQTNEREQKTTSGEETFEKNERKRLKVLKHLAR